jgi:hypothetical protein
VMGAGKDLHELEDGLELKISVHSRMRKSFLDDMYVSGMAKKMICWKHVQHQQHFRPAHLPQHLIVSQEEVVNLSGKCMGSFPAVASYLNPTS